MSFRITKRAPRHTALALALALGLGVVGTASGQETAGSIYGSAPSDAGQTIHVTSNTGIDRTVQIAPDGSFSTVNLPAGTYTATLIKDGAPVSTRVVTIVAGAGTQISFVGANEAIELGAVRVTANALPAIDVTQAATAFVVTAEQLEKLPVGHSAEAIALLAPGVVGASGYFGDSITFAGAGATENAYYVNGWNTTSLYDYTGASYQLPYGAIAQQQTIVGGYDARYGRTTGGVLAQIGARGTNEWHAGAQFTWSPRALEAEHENTYYPEIDLQPGEELTEDAQPGDLYSFAEYDNSWAAEASVYASGPLIEDTLFFHVSVEQFAEKFRNVTSSASRQDQFTKDRQTKWYGKIDWNINDSNILEYTKLQLDGKFGYGESYRFNYDTKTSGEKLGDLSYLKFTHDTDIFHYTSYLTDSATLSILYGQSEVKNPLILPSTSDLPYIAGGTTQDPSITPDPILNDQVNTQINSPHRTSGSRGLRVDFEYRLGDHTLQAGIDNLKYEAEDQGRLLSGPGYQWVYSKTEPDADINTTLGVGAPGGDGYYVNKNTFSTVTSMSAVQNAWYLQDRWDVTDNLMLQLGIRNDDFENLNADGAAFVTQKDQWAPRLGFTWDVNGDSSFKLYGTLGRYNLAIPQATGERAAGSSYNTSEYFTYTGINENGIPTGLTPVPGIDGAGPPGEVSANGEFGQSIDPDTVTSNSLKPQYQDELILGFDKLLGSDWVYGAKGTYRTLGTAIDDMCDPRAVPNALEEAGYDPDNYQPLSPYCRIMNPNLDNTYTVNGLDGRDPVEVTVTQEDMGFPDLQRDYYSLSFYLEHPFADNWFGRFSYTFARSWGNAEGQVRSDIGQTDVAVTEDWDYAELMSNARGYLANHRRHQLKGFAAWQLTQEWLVSGVLTVKSGMPQSCLGWFGTEQTNPGGGYGTDYHWCRGEPAPPGGDVSGGMNPWTYDLNLGVVYAPNFADQHLKFKLAVFNAFDNQETLQTVPHLYPRSGRTIDNQYHIVAFRQDPRSVSLSVSYDY